MGGGLLKDSSVEIFPNIVAVQQILVFYRAAARRQFSSAISPKPYAALAKLWGLMSIVNLLLPWLVMRFNGL